MKLFFIITSALFLSHNVAAGKWDINVETDIKRQTEFRDCDALAHSLCELTALWVQEKNAKDKKIILSLAKDVKKLLHRCEKTNRRDLMPEIKIGTTTTIEF